MLIIVIYAVIKWYVKKKYNGFLEFYDRVQENTIKKANSNLNKHLLEYSNKPTLELWNKIVEILNQNESYIILTFLDNKDPNDNRTFNLTNSINFRKIKNGEIGVFTDFDLMRKYVRNYISTEIILVGDFIKICETYNLETIIFNFTLPNPFMVGKND